MRFARESTPGLSGNLIQVAETEPASSYAGIRDSQHCGHRPGWKNKWPMRVRVFATDPLIGSQEPATQQRQSPEEGEPGRQVKCAGSTWHGLSRCFPMVEVFAREHFNNRGRIDSRA
jgi:hypothetical protein